VNVGELLADRHAVRLLAFSEHLEPPAEDVLLPEPVVGEITLAGTGRTVRLTGQVHAVATLACGACLRRFREPLSIELSEEFCRPAASVETGDETESASGDSLASLEPGDVIDLTEVVRQHLVVLLPIAPRCREDCRGLCPRCGADLNAGPCGCDLREGDPRLEGLRRWRAGGPEGE